MRWIAQLVADAQGRVYAIDNNGVAWRLVEYEDNPGTVCGTIAGAKWERLPVLPSIENRPAAAAPLPPAAE